MLNKSIRIVHFLINLKDFRLIFMLVQGFLFVGMTFLESFILQGCLISLSILLVNLDNFLGPFGPVPALDPLAVELALDVRCDPQLCGVPEAIHFSSEVLGELG